MRVLTVVGARPQFIKAAVVTRALAEAGVDEVLVHTGQHYDTGMSDVFFEELDIPPPAYHLGVGSGHHGAQTGEMLARIEKVLMKERPDWVVVYGDTNSTLAGALVAAKLHLPIAHIEAGLRSFNRRMPEEVNRVLTDHVSELLFCPTTTATENLRREGITGGVVLSGDVMLDATRLFSRLIDERRANPHTMGAYYLATVHRAENTDAPHRLRGILEGLERLDAPVVLPLHPRTRTRLEGVRIPANVQIMEPVGYVDMLALTRGALAVLTDSGGLQKEAYWLGIPCVTLREETEWIETLGGGWNRLAGANPEVIEQCARSGPDGPQVEFGDIDGESPVKIIVRKLETDYSERGRCL